MNQVTDPNIRARRITRTSYIGIGDEIRILGGKGRCRRASATGC